MLEIVQCAAVLLPWVIWLIYDFFIKKPGANPASEVFFSKMFWMTMIILCSLMIATFISVPQGYMMGYGSSVNQVVDRVTVIENDRYIKEKRAELMHIILDKNVSGKEFHRMLSIIEDLD